jgi:hypothetical protein
MGLRWLYGSGAFIWDWCFKGLELYAGVAVSELEQFSL